MFERLQRDRPDDWKDIKLVSPAPADDINWLVVSLVPMYLLAPRAASLAYWCVRCV